MTPTTKGTSSSSSSAAAAILELDDPNPDPFYDMQASFTSFSLLALVYRAISKVIMIFSVSTQEEKLCPEERFVIPPSSSPLSSSSSSSSSSDINADRHVAIVTGSNTGIGFETASSLVGLGYVVILACRNRSKGEEAAAKINARNNNNESNNNNNNNNNTNNNNNQGSKVQKGRAIFLHSLDLSSIESVKSFAEAFTSKFHHLNILVNNAGLGSTPPKSKSDNDSNDNNNNNKMDLFVSNSCPESKLQKSDDGMDLTFQTNFVGHYLLTRLLIPHLLKAKNIFPSKGGGMDGNGSEAGRVVNLSSVKHHFVSPKVKRGGGGGGDKGGEGGSGAASSLSGGGGGTVVHDEEFWRGCATPFVSCNTYAESKLAMILFAQVLNEKYGSQGLRAVSCNPGAVYSDIWRNKSPTVQKIYSKLFLTPKQGSSTSLASAVGDLPKDALYLQPYWQPAFGIGGSKCKVLSNSKSMSWLWYSCPHPITEMMGPYIGFAVMDCRLPPYPESRHALWNVCEELVGLKDKKRT